MPSSVPEKANAIFDDRRQTLPVYRIAYVANFLLTATAGAVFVLLSDLQDAFDLPTWGLGVIAGAGFVGSLITQLLVSPFADRGATFGVGALGLLAGIAGSFWFVVADSLGGFAGSRALLGAGLGLFIVASRKAVIGLNEEGSGARLGALLSANVTGFLFGPLLGAALASDRVGLGIDAPFIVLGVATVLVTPPALVWLRSAPVATSAVPFSAMLGLARRPGIQAAMLGQAVLFANIGIFDGTIDRFLTDLGADNTVIAFVLLAVGLPLVFLPRHTGALADRQGGERILVAAIAVAVPALLLYGSTSIIIVIAIAGLIQGTTEAFAFPAAQVIVVNETGASEAAIGQALLDVVGSTSAAMWAFLGPALYGEVGPRTLFAIAALNAAVLGFAAHRRFLARDRQLAQSTPVSV